MIELRLNQIPVVEKGIEFFRKEKTKPSLIVLPTAWGKSILAAFIAREIGKILILQPTIELLHQNYEKYINLGGVASIYSAGAGIKEIGNVTFATIGSIKNLGLLFKDYGFKNLIIDEVHTYPRNTDGMLGKFLIDSEITHILGITATPVKLQTNSVGGWEKVTILKMLTSRSKKGNLFKEILHVSQIQEMIDLKYWSPVIYELHKTNDNNLIYNTSNSEYTDESILEWYDNQGIEQKIIDRIKLLDDTKNILVAVPSVKHAIKLANKIPGAHAIWGEMDKKVRKATIDAFKAGQIKIIIQVRVLSIGFDYPALNCIIGGTPTASLAWVYQFISRGIRIHPNKENCLYIDFTNNTNKFGKIENLRYVKELSLWKLYGEDNKLLTGIPLTELGKHTQHTENQTIIKKQLEKNNKKLIESEKLMTFGKFKGYRIDNLPPWYKNWMLKNFEFNNKTMYIKNEILKKTQT